MKIFNLKGELLKDTPGANLREANLREANLREANLREANLREANLREADLRGADLRGANLYWADLRGADLRGADLREANLYWADLCEANLVIGFSFGVHFGFYHEGYCKIGCIGMGIEKWVKEFKSIGKANNYTEDQIWAYGQMIKLLAEKHKRKIAHNSKRRNRK